VGLRLVGLGEHEGQRGLAPVADEQLAAGDHVLLAVAAGRGGLVAGVGAGLGLGEREAADDVAAGHRGQEALALGVVPYFKIGSP